MEGWACAVACSQLSVIKSHYLEMTTVETATGSNDSCFFLDHTHQQNADAQEDSPAHLHLRVTVNTKLSTKPGGGKPLSHWLTSWASVQPQCKSVKWNASHSGFCLSVVLWDLEPHFYCTSSLYSKPTAISVPLWQTPIFPCQTLTS